MIRSIHNFVTHNVTKIYHGHSNIILDLSGFKSRILDLLSGIWSYWIRGREFLILRYVASLKAGQSALYTTHVTASEIQNGLAEKRTRMDADGCTEYRNLLCDKICRPTPRLFQRTPRRTARRIYMYIHEAYVYATSFVIYWLCLWLIPISAIDPRWTLLITNEIRTSTVKMNSVILSFIAEECRRKYFWNLIFLNS